MQKIIIYKKKLREILNGKDNTPKALIKWIWCQPMGHFSWFAKVITLLGRLLGCVSWDKIIYFLLDMKMWILKQRPTMFHCPVTECLDQSPFSEWINTILTSLTQEKSGWRGNLRARVLGVITKTIEFKLWPRIFRSKSFSEQKYG